MHQVNIYRGSELLYTMRCTVVPPEGAFLWINGSSEYLEVTGVCYDLVTVRTAKGEIAELKINLIVK